jgi:hypothetical protein
MSIRLVLVLTIFLLSTAPALANRHIVVNGKTLSPDEVALLDSFACTYVQDGRYWLAANGAWGYEGFPIQMGVVGEMCLGGQATAPRRKSLSERGLLYSPGELLR